MRMYDIIMKKRNGSALSQEEIDLCTAWRRCTDKERETIAFILRDYGFTFQRKSTASADIA